MASSSNRKSSSSASKQKPTFRKAGSPGSRPASSKPAASSAPRPANVPPARKAISAYSAPAKKRPLAKPAPKAPARALAKGGPRPTPRGSALPAKGGSPRQRPAAAPRPMGAPGKVAASKPVMPKASPKKLSSLPAHPRAEAPASPGPIKGLLGRIPLPRIPRGIVFGVLGIVAVLVVAFAVVVNSGLFAATDVWIKGSEHVSKEAAEQLIDLPEGTSLLNVDESAISERLKQNPWVSGVDIERVYPHTLVIKPHERAVAAVVYIASDDIAWAIGDDGCWIAPVSLSQAADAAAAPAEPADDAAAASDAEPPAGDDPDAAAEGDSDADAVGDADAADAEAAAAAEAAEAAEAARRQSSLEAARKAAQEAGALLMTDVASGVSPASGKPVESDVVLAGLKYVKDLTPEFLSKVKFMSLPSKEAIAVTLDSGIEIALGAPDDIKTKERVVTKLLEQESGVTYIDVRVPGNYTFRSAPL